MTLEINELNVQISIISDLNGVESSSPAAAKSHVSPTLADFKEEIVRQAIAEIMSRIRRSGVR